MARIRSIKQSFFTNEDLADCPPLARLLFSGLWTIADREGRLIDRPRKIKVEILPYDECDIEALLTILVDKKFIIRYEVEGSKFIQVVNFLKHQQPHYKEFPSQIPPPPGQGPDVYVAQPTTKEQRERIFERDGRKCQECGSENKLSIDHVIPRSKGGTSDDENLRTLCLSCNSSKGNREAAAVSDQDQGNVGSTSVQRRFDKSDASPMVNGEWSLVNGERGVVNGNGSDPQAEKPEESPPGVNPLVVAFARICKLNLSSLRKTSVERLSEAMDELRGMLKQPDEVIAARLQRFGEFFETLKFTNPIPYPSQVPGEWLKFEQWERRQSVAKAKTESRPADPEISGSLTKLKNQQRKSA